MRGFHLHHHRLTLPCAALLSLGCGLVDDTAEQRSAASWCDEAANGEVAAVAINWRAVDGTLLEEDVTLLDAKSRALVRIDLTEDGTHTRRTIYWRNTSGQEILEELDDGDDGVVDSTLTMTYDDEGRRVLTSYDKDNNGTVDTTEAVSYTATELRDIVDSNDDGTPDATYVATYDAAGELIREEFDDDADGVAEQTQNYTYSDSGLLLETTREIGGHTETWTLEYDDEGRILREIYAGDEPLAGIGSEDTYEYDGDLLVAISTDFGQDGDIDSMERRTYDSEGRLVRSEVRYGDGALHWVHEYEYDGETKVRSSFDSDGDGSWDSETIRTAC